MNDLLATWKELRRSIAVWQCKISDTNKLMETYKDRMDERRFGDQSPREVFAESNNHSMTQIARFEQEASIVFEEMDEIEQHQAIVWRLTEA